MIKEIKGTTAPSFVLPDMERGIIYAVEEIDNGTVLAIDAETGKILSRISSGGSAPCHLALNADKTYLSVSNYMSGSIELIHLDEKGLPEKISDVIKKETSGQHPLRQDCSHMHFSSFCGHQLFACDLGSNTIFRYDVVNGHLCNEAQPFYFPDAVGPRHFVIKDQIIYVMSEMGASIFAYHMKDGRKIQEVSLLEEGINRETIPVIDVDAFGAAIKMSSGGRYLVVSVRGTDQLQLFRVEADGKLERCATSTSGGRIPRDAEFCGGYVVAANQEGDSVCSVAFDDKSGKLQGTVAELKISKPTCIQNM